MERMRVLAIIGAGRSGSTLLDRVLGSAPGVVSAGELCHFESATRPGGEHCSCGVPGSDCGFWCAVKESFARFGGNQDRYVALRDRYERLRAWPRVAVSRRRPSAAWRDYTAQSVALFRALIEQGEGRVVVDSSKRVVRALALASIPELDVYLLHLVRDGRGVAWSYAKSFQADPGAGVQTALAPRSITRSALNWTLVNRLADRARTAVPPERSSRVRYEDYLSDLPGTLAPLSDFVGYDLRARAREILDGAPLAPGHLVAGNRLRMQRQLVLRTDEEWRRALSPGDRQRFQRLAGTTLRRFGYDD